MKLRILFSSIWKIIPDLERKRLYFLGVISSFGTILEMLSVGALVPLVAALARADGDLEFPLVTRVFSKSTNESTAAILMAAVILIFLVKNTFLGWSLWLQRDFVARLEARFQTELFNRYIKREYEYHLQNNTAQLARNILNSTNFTNNVLDPALILLTDGAVAVALCIALVVIEPITMLTTVIIVSLVTSAFHNFSKTRIENWGKERNLHDGLKIVQINDTLGGIKEVQLSGRGNYFENRFAYITSQLSGLNQKFTFMLGLPRLYLELLAIVGLAALVLSMLAVGRTTASILPSLALFAGSTFRLLPAVNRIMFALQSLRMGQAIVDNLHLELAIESNNENEIEHLEPLYLEDQICFDDVSYSYPGSKKNVLEAVTFQTSKGKFIGIIGATGAGKSTFVDLLLGVLRPTSGQIRVDGIDIAQNIKGWQSTIGYVSQSIFLIDSTIRENVAFGVAEEDIDDSRVRSMLSVVHLSDFVDSLPEGTYSSVGERGGRLSGGQKQRIAIARALYKDPKVLVFDESTSALDTTTEDLVLNSLDALRSNMTFFFITHRESTLCRCDQIIRIENGKASVIE